MFIIVFFAFLGFLSFSNLVISLLRHIHRYFLRRPKSLSLYGPWAVITGCTDGIGRALAHELANHNLNLILVGRNPAKLNSVATSIQTTHKKILIKNVVVDLNDCSKNVAVRVKEEIGGVEVGVLVSCAGVLNAHPEYFHEVEMERWMEILRVNVEAATAVTKVVVEGMVERGKGGAVVTIGSGTGSVLGVPSFPLFDVYAGTKAYLSQLSKSLHAEYKHRGIDVQCQIPFFVNTKMVAEMSDIHSQFFAVPTAERYARSAVRWFGYDRECVPVFSQLLESSLIHMLPVSVTNFILLHMMLNHRDSR